MNRPILLVLLNLALTLGLGVTTASDPAQAAPAQAEAASDELLRLLAGAGTDEQLVRWQDRTGGKVTFHLATRVNAPAQRLIERLADPKTYRAAVPAFVRADVKREQAVPASAGRGPGGQPRPAPARYLDWELEIPLWNLAGQLWLRPHAKGATLDLVEGDLAPGRFDLEVNAAEGGTTLLLTGGARLENANFVTRRLAARDPEAAPAMSLTSMYVLLRALALQAEQTTTAPSPRRQPTVAMAAPAPRAVDAALFAARLRELGPAPTVGFARIANRGDGRLDRVEVAVPQALSAATAMSRALEAQRWRALPGWSSIEVESGPAPLHARWHVEAGLPFVDFDATWLIHTARPLRAEARGGDWQGAVMTLEALDKPGGAYLIMTLHPRVDRVGYLPRKLIEAEPLLEQGLSLGLGFVNTRALARSLARP